MPSNPTRRAFLAAGGGFAALSALDDPSLARQDDVPPTTAEPDDAEALIEEVVEPASGGITMRTLEEAEKLAAVRFTERERSQILEVIESDVERFARRRAVTLPNDLAPALHFDPRLPGESYELRQTGVQFELPGREVLPVREPDIAYASLTQLSAWIRDRRITSRELTRLYLDRLARLDPKLAFVVTSMEESALEQAKAADHAIARGEWRGPLHGMPWGAKDLLDTAGVRTTWGATPYRERVPDQNAVVVQRLADAGAVLMAKLSLGALAYGDIWFGGRTNNPFHEQQGSSGSSAGSAAATAAGCVAFALGTETLGSIVSPCMRCGATGLRPTFGRVARTGAMSLCWSLDKIGPIARTVQDCMIVLNAINGADTGDPSSIDAPLAFNAKQPVSDLVVGYDPAWFEDASDTDNAGFDAVLASGMRLREITLPDWPYDALLTGLMVEAAAAFEDLTLTNRDDELVWQDTQAWPNAFRMTRFTSAIEFVQSDRFRRQVMRMMHDIMRDVDCIIAPSYAGSLLLITNNTGHPSLTLRTGFRENGTPSGITLIGRLFDEGTLCSAGMALERELDVWHRRPMGE
jgi:Asp-tRNA(Asn)/Glu-tRNA(Gln) amidotransferase A subunit family amidase